MSIPTEGVPIEEHEETSLTPRQRALAATAALRELVLGSPEEQFINFLMENRRKIPSLSDPKFEKALRLLGELSEKQFERLSRKWIPESARKMLEVYFRERKEQLQELQQREGEEPRRLHAG